MKETRLEKYLKDFKVIELKQQAIVDNNVT